MGGAKAFHLSADAQDVTLAAGVGLVGIDYHIGSWAHEGLAGDVTKLDLPTADMLPREQAIIYQGLQRGWELFIVHVRVGMQHLPDGSQVEKLDRGLCLILGLGDDDNILGGVFVGVVPVFFAAASGEQGDDHYRRNCSDGYTDGIILHRWKVLSFAVMSVRSGEREASFHSATMVQRTSILKQVLLCWRAG